MTTQAQCLKLLGLSELPLPVPIEQWVESPLGLRLGVTDLSHLGLNVLGVARPKDREILVSETIADQENRFRFTIAHELGHVILHAKVQAEFRELVEGDALGRRFEREADRFAASFLMPIEQFGKEVVSLCEAAPVAPRALLLSAQENEATALRLIRSKLVPGLARRFGVSLSAATFRFADVQLNNGLPLLSHQQAKSLLPTSASRLSA